MPLKYKIKTKAEIPAGLEAHYAEREVQEEGAKITYFFLDVEGAVDKSRVDEFRQNNIALNQKVKDLETKYDGIDPEKARKLMEIASDLEAEKLLKKGEVDKIVETRTKAMRDDYDKKVKTFETENVRLNARLTEVEINQATVTSASKRGLKPTAQLDITARARGVFRVVDGKVVPVEADGKTPIIGKNGIDPMTIDEWVEKQTTDAPHLFEPNSGGGGGGNNNQGGGGQGKGPNPFMKGTKDWNVTKQMQLSKADPALAQRYREQAAQASAKAA